MVATKDIVAGDSRVWKLNRQRLLAMGEAPQNSKIEALLRTSEGSLVNLIVVGRWACDRDLDGGCLRNAADGDDLSDRAIDS